MEGAEKDGGNLKFIEHKHGDDQLSRACILPVRSLLSLFSTIFDFFPNLYILLASVSNRV